MQPRGENVQQVGHLHNRNHASIVAMTVSQDSVVPADIEGNPLASSQQQGGASGKTNSSETDQLS